MYKVFKNELKVNIGKIYEGKFSKLGLKSDLHA